MKIWETEKTKYSGLKAHPVRLKILVYCFHNQKYSNANIQKYT